jgi:hypothetical protein
MPILLVFIYLSINIFNSKIQWTTPTSHDFGEIGHKQPQSFTFEFKNLSLTPVVIDNVRTECGCTATDWAQEPVPASQSGRIKVTYDAHSVGYFKKKITVWIHGQRKAEKLYIEGEVVP